MVIDPRGSEDSLNTFRMDIICLSESEPIACSIGILF
jgi:hypothetical protein